MACREGERYRIDYLEDLLAEDERVRYERHAAGCEECTRAIAEERSILAMVRAPAREEPSARVRADILRQARLAADRAPRRRFRDIFESPLLQTVALATLVVGIAFVFEDQLPHAGLPSLKDSLRARFGAPAEGPARGDADAERAEKRVAAVTEPLTETARAPSPAAPPPPAAVREAPTLALREAPPPPALGTATSGAPARTMEAPAAAAPKAERADGGATVGADAFADRDLREVSPEAAAEAPSPFAEIRDLIESEQWREALERVDAALAAEWEPNEAIALLDLGIEAADALGDDIHSIRYRVERVSRIRARDLASEE